MLFTKIKTDNVHIKSVKQSENFVINIKGKYCNTDPSTGTSRLFRNNGLFSAVSATGPTHAYQKESFMQSDMKTATQFH
jgi:hypothetical protein